MKQTKENGEYELQVVVAQDQIALPQHHFPASPVMRGRVRPGVAARRVPDRSHHKAGPIEGRFFYHPDTTPRAVMIVLR